MKLYNISGGATKIGGLFAKSERIIKEFGYKPDVISGVSSGALLALPIALGKWDELKQLTSDFDLDTIFDNKPFNEKGKITAKAIWRVITGKPSFGTQKNLEKALSNLITEEIFQDYILKASKKELPKVFVGVTNFNTGKFELVDITKVSYSNYIKYVIASTSIPLAVEAVEIKNNYYYDGGVLHHTCTSAIINKYGSEISHCITVFSRPEEPDLSYKNFNQIDISQVFKATQDLQIANISISDQRIEKLLCEQYNIVNKQVFCPKVLTSMYDVDKVRLQKLYYKSYMTENYINYIDFI
jgi:predicted acylesterase/phospholipase RssA